MHATPHPFSQIDMQFIGKNKTNVTNLVLKYANLYLLEVRSQYERARGEKQGPPTDAKQGSPTETKQEPPKAITFDMQSKDQIMYIFYKLLHITANMSGNKSENIPAWIKESLGTTTSNYKLYTFIDGVTCNAKYTMLGGEVEECVLLMIDTYFEDEEIMQHMVETFILFIKKFAQMCANVCWMTTKKITYVVTNGLLRNMDNRNINPDLFTEIFMFSEYAKTLKTGKAT